MARSVLVNEGPILELLKLPGQSKNITPPTRVKSMIDMERDHILSALRECNGRIYGQGGAAELLELNPSTLNSRMKKLGIEKKYT